MDDMVRRTAGAPRWTREKKVGAIGFYYCPRTMTCDIRAPQRCPGLKATNVFYILEMEI